MSEGSARGRAPNLVTLTIREPWLIDVIAEAMRRAPQEGVDLLLSQVELEGRLADLLGTNSSSSDPVVRSKEAFDAMAAEIHDLLSTGGSA